MDSLGGGSSFGGLLKSDGASEERSGILTNGMKTVVNRELIKNKLLLQRTLLAFSRERGKSTT